MASSVSMCVMTQRIKRQIGTFKDTSLSVISAPVCFVLDNKQRIHIKSCFQYNTCCSAFSAADKIDTEHNKMLRNKVIVTNITRHPVTYRVLLHRSQGCNQ